jgi:aryl-alcohol dehydrogenase-like predicted oxidoreductase
MQTRRLGRTEHRSSVAILGGAAFWEATGDEVAAAFELAESHGVNHLDIAPRYGVAEEVVGPVLAGRRDRWFVAAKTWAPDKDRARAELERTLERLRTDHLDLYQLHAVTTVAELDGRAGAVETLLAARDEGLVRHLGVTGHDLGAPAAHLEALVRYDLDTVMFPVYPRVWAEPQYRADAEALLAECARRDVGAMAIKAVAKQPWAAKQPSPSPWYEPHTDPDGIRRGVAFALSTPGICGFCTPGSLALLPAVLEAAAALQDLDAEARALAAEEMSSNELIFPLAEKARR